MNFEQGKQYIVDVTDKGIVPIEEFSAERFFDKDNDDLDFLTDEEKAEIIRKTLVEIKGEIEELQKACHEFGWVYEDSIEIIDKHISGEGAINGFE